MNINFTNENLKLQAYTYELKSLLFPDGPWCVCVRVFVGVYRTICVTDVFHL